MSLRRTKIICTAGPSIASEKSIADLVNKGMSIIRLNCSHGNNATRLQDIKRVRRVEKKLKTPIGIMIDLQGPKLRVDVLDTPIMLHRDEVWKMSPDEAASASKKIIPVSFSDLPKAVSVGGALYMDDGLIQTKVVKKNRKYVWIKIIHGGHLESRKGINIPDYKGRHALLNKEDTANLVWGLKQDVDFVALSFVRNAQDVVDVKKFIKRKKPKVTPLIIAKIEKPQAVDSLDEIIDKSDGILVARGDLGIELKPEKVPVIQKRIIEGCRKSKKPVIVATQMLDSMRINPRPTRAEVSDVASAIYASADAVLLTGETSSGKYPVKSTEMMGRIIDQVEGHMMQKTFRKRPKDFGVKHYHEAFLFNAMQLAGDIAANAIVVLTKQGKIIKTLSKLHPKKPVYSIARDLTAYRQLNLFWGVFPLEVNQALIDKRIAGGVQLLRKRKIVKKGDKLIFIYRDFQSDNLNLKALEV